MDKDFEKSSLGEIDRIAERSLIELDVAGVHPSELFCAPNAEPVDIVPVILLREDDPLIERFNGDVCELGKNWRQGLERMVARELSEGVEIDLMEAFEEALTHADLEN